MTKAIIFDLGGVLIDNPSKGLKQYCANVLGVSVQKYISAVSQYKYDFQLGDISENFFWQQICDELNIDMPKSTSLWGDAVKEVFNKKSEMFEFIDKLRGKGYKIGLLSNTEMPVVEYWKENNYMRYFDDVVFSCVEHMVKPDKEIYKLICERLEVLPQEAVFIDDKPKFIDGAKNIGIEGTIFESTEQIISDLRNLIDF